MNRTLDILKNKLVDWFEIAVASIPNILIAALVLYAFITLGRFVQSVLERVLRRASNNTAVIKLTMTAARVAILILGLFAALTVLNLDKAAVSLLAGAGVLGLVIGFAFQEIAANFFSGVLIAFMRPYKVGDIVSIESHMGEVIEISLRTTSIMTPGGLEVLVPNKDMFTKAVTNYTSTPFRRVDITCGVSYADDLDLVEKLVRQAVENLPGRLPDQPVDFYFQNFGDSSINFLVTIWITYPGDNFYFKAIHQGIKNIKALFDQNNITIPFPIRTLEMKSMPGTMKFPPSPSI